MQGKSPAPDAFFLGGGIGMYICYLDESGTVDRSGSTEHFVLVGLAVLAEAWKAKDQQIDAIKGKYGLSTSEIHTAWMTREYPEQKTIAGFADLDMEERRQQCLAARRLNLARPRRNRSQVELLKNYRKTAAYVHLTKDERLRCIQELADLIGSWADARIFAEAQFKRHMGGSGDFSIAFEQVVTRFNTCLRNVGGMLGILVQDNNPTVAGRLTDQMRKFHREGTAWTREIDKIVETPMFVDSELTSMVQMADLVAYAIRRFFDHDEQDLFDRISPAFDRNTGRLVGVRHYTTRAFLCTCRVCTEHGRRSA
ncbi:MAG: DUF3800 domain-containing protein [Anaerolineae bacterium]|nr:DUF3800 domain-containing protein [Anaerolineae bacterium]